MAGLARCALAQRGGKKTRQPAYYPFVKRSYVVIVGLSFAAVACAVGGTSSDDGTGSSSSSSSSSSSGGGSSSGSTGFERDGGSSSGSSGSSGASGGVNACGVCDRSWTCNGFPDMWLSQGGLCVNQRTTTALHCNGTFDQGGSTHVGDWSGNATHIALRYPMLGGGTRTIDCYP